MLIARLVRLSSVGSAAASSPSATSSTLTSAQLSPSERFELSVDVVNDFLDVVSVRVQAADPVFADREERFAARFVLNLTEGYLKTEDTKSPPSGRISTPFRLFFSRQDALIYRREPRDVGEQGQGNRVSV
jgi:hypothetical protein